MAKVLPSSWEVPAKLRDRFGEQAGRQRAMSADGHLLLVLHEVPKPSEPSRSAVLFWRAPSGAWRSHGPSGGGGKAGLSAHVDAFVSAAVALDARLDAASKAADYFEVIQAAAPLARTSRHLLATLQAAREACPEDRELIVLRDRAADAERAAELAHGDAKAGLDFTIAKRGEEQAALAERIAASGHKLNLIAALFLPLSAVGSMFGMNFQHGLETLHAPWLFWIVLGLAFAFGYLVRASIRG
jgi:hypothetical protein